MAVNKRKVLEAARKLATKGAKDKALTEYDKLLELDPRDTRIRLEIGDTYRRWGRNAEAVESFTAVAEQFMKEGFDARAVAVYKQILDLDSLSCCEPLAELYQRMGLNSEATSVLQTAADGHRRAGDKAAELGLLRKVAKLDPSNTTRRLKVAGLLHQEGMNSDAVIEYDAVVEELLAQGDQEGVSRVYEQLLDVEPDRVSSLTGYARNLIDRGSADHAEPFARRALEADVSPAHYELLGEVLRVTGRDEELVELYRELAALYRERGDEERTREILQCHVPSEGSFGSTEPTDYLDQSESSPALGEGSDDSQTIGHGDSGLGIVTDLDAGDKLPIMDPNSGPDVKGVTPIIPEDAVPLSDDVDQLFAEASVYLRYGKREQAVANLEGVLEIDPTHRGALEKLGEAYVEGEDMSRAIEAWSRAEKLALEEDEIEAANAIRDRISAIAATSAADLLSDIDPENSSESDLEEIGLDDIEVDVDDARFAVGRTDRLCVEPQTEVTARHSPSEQVSDAENLDGSVEREPDPKQIGEDLEEADFYLEQGLLDEAEAIYSRVVEVAPDHQHALERMGDVAAQRGGDSDSSRTGIGFDVSVVAVERDVPDDRFATAFSGFKKGVSETPNESDYGAHYDLGIAYREMGLLDDAMTEFQAAMANPNRRLECLHLLVLCALDAGQPGDPMAHLQMAIEMDGLTPEQVSALRFDLGRCFEQSGDIEAARTEFLAVHAEHPQFADVGSRLQRIGKSDKTAQDESPFEPIDDFFTDSRADTGQDDSDPELELGTQPEPPKARKKRKISFF